MFQTSRGWSWPVRHLPAVAMVLGVSAIALAGSGHLPAQSVQNQSAYLPMIDGEPSTAYLPDGRWVETFDTLDPTRWQVEHSIYGHDSVHCYHPDNVIVVGGALHLQARAEETSCPHGVSRSYSSGMVRSRGLVDFTHGLFEIEARTPVGAGLWPALWLSPTERMFGPWPRSGEIDIAEVVGSEPDRVVCSVHFWSVGQGHAKTVGAVEFEPAIDGSPERTFSLLWTPDEMVWSVDGRPCHRAAIKHLGTPEVFDQRFHLKLNLAVGGDWPGPPDQAAFPAVFVIDEIRYTPLALLDQ